MNRDLDSELSVQKKSNSCVDFTTVHYLFLLDLLGHHPRGICGSV